MEAYNKMFELETYTLTGIDGFPLNPERAQIEPETVKDFYFQHTKYKNKWLIMQFDDSDDPEIPPVQMKTWTEINGKYVDVQDVPLPDDFVDDITVQGNIAHCEITENIALQAHVLYLRLFAYAMDKLTLELLTTEPEPEPELRF